MTSEIIYLGDLRTQATHLQSGTVIITDAPTDNQGKGEAFSPTDLCATSLGSCMLTIMGIAARLHGINMDGTKVSMLKVMAADPRRIGRIELRFDMPNVVYSPKQKKILERAAKTCPVFYSVEKKIEKVIIFDWKD